jgi:hypothetical protein
MTLTPPPVILNTGGAPRKAPGDCATRAIAIVSGRHYDEVAAAIDTQAQRERPGARKHKVSRSSAREGVFRRTIDWVLVDLWGWTWTPMMGIGTGCRMHVAAEELPAGRHVLSLSRHLTALVDGEIHDLYDPSRGGTRCVYGYWTPPASQRPAS